MKKKIIIGILIIVIGISIFLFSNMDKEEAITYEEEPIIKEETKVDTKIKVDIKGAINKPGVYEVDSNYRVNDVIALAGGLKKDANTNYINLSAKVTDEMVIWIYTKKEIEEFKLENSSANYMIKECNCPTVDNTTCLNNSNDSSNKVNGKVNLNSASIEELMTLDGIGESKAQAIIEYRKTKGNFTKIEDLLNVSGIGESLYNKVKDNITV